MIFIATIDGQVVDTYESHSCDHIETYEEGFYAARCLFGKGPNHALRTYTISGDTECDDGGHKLLESTFARRIIGQLPEPYKSYMIEKGDT
jgi:hypothetical protein